MLCAVSSMNTVVSFIFKRKCQSFPEQRAWYEADLAALLKSLPPLLCASEHNKEVIVGDVCACYQRLH